MSRQFLYQLRSFYRREALRRRHGRPAHLAVPAAVQPDSERHARPRISEAADPPDQRDGGPENGGSEAAARGPGGPGMGQIGDRGLANGRRAGATEGKPSAAGRSRRAGRARGSGPRGDRPGGDRRRRRPRWRPRRPRRASRIRSRPSRRSARDRARKADRRQPLPGQPGARHRQPHARHGLAAPRASCGGSTAPCGAPCARRKANASTSS